MAISTLVLNEESKSVKAAKQDWQSLGGCEAEREWAIGERNNIHPFCVHLVNEEGYTAEQICNVLDNPRKWGVEYKRYLLWYYTNLKHGVVHLGVECRYCKCTDNDLTDTTCSHCSNPLNLL